MPLFTRHLILTFILFRSLLHGQLSFVLTSTLCSGDSVFVSANTNSYPATSFSWTSQPSGVVFSNHLASSTSLYFPQSGFYTITLMGSVGNTTAYATQTIQVFASPQLTISSSSSTICPGQSATLIASGAATYTWVPSPGLSGSFGGTAFVSPGTTSIYSVTGSSTAACLTSATYTLTFGTFPNLVLVAADTAVCAGFTTLVNAFGANQYTWTSSNFTGSITQASLAAGAGIYSVMASNGGSCKDSANIQVFSRPPLNLSILADRTIICKDGGDTLVPIHLTAQGAGTYAWEPFHPFSMTYSIGPSTSVSPSLTTCYTLTGMSPGCSGTSVLCIQVGYCTSLDEQEKESGISVFPNPFQSELVVKMNFTGQLSLEIDDLIGNTLVSLSPVLESSDTIRLDVSGLAKGIYILKITQGSDTRRIQKIIKN